MSDTAEPKKSKKEAVLTFVKSLWRKDKPVETERRIRANDPEFNASLKYAKNYIATSKYNLINFLPKNLFEQFQRLANAYFLILVLLQLIPEISSLPPQTTVIPLVAVLAVSAVKDAIDDIQRHRSDNEVNNRRSLVLRHGKLVEEPWKHVVVGDIIKMENGHFVAADLLILSSSEPNSLCFIDTAELDGETNLKVKQALTITSELQDDLGKMAAFDGEISCEAPNNNLNKFEGVLKLGGQVYSLDNEKILLRGCVLRNTQWCYGLVLFAGSDTKLMMNSGKVIFKRTQLDKTLDILVFGNIIFLLCACFFCMICCGIWETVVGYSFQAYLPWEMFVPGSRNFRNPVAAGATVIAILVFFSYIILLSAVVPISLYVSVEMIRFTHSWWINWDLSMYYEKNNTPAKARTTTLNEELGQIEYVFSDKTGTLTQNIMTFNRVSIHGRTFGGIVDAEGNELEKEEYAERVDFSSNPYAEESLVWYDARVVELVKKGDVHCHQFFRLLALCHTVMATETNGKLEYQAQSPDESALVNAARNFGFVFQSRTPDTITIDVNGRTEEYELLCILDFNNVRKRMSVILRREGKIMLYCKGADSLIYERLDSSCEKMKEITTVHLNEFAGAGLRTLCLAVKEIDESYFEDWKRRYHLASTSLVDREDKVAAIYEEIEKNMILIGATAIEDKLQDGVPDAIASLAVAGIKIWVLTGDKQETAINIGYCCKLLSDDLEEIYIIDGDTDPTVEEQLSKAKEDMFKKMAIARLSNGEGDGNGTAMDADVVYSVDMPLPVDSALNLPEDFGGFAIIINGHSLVHALTDKMEKLLLEVGCMCKAVICCRVTPLQKALVVDLVKKHKKSTTLAIGDGANDVSMIKMAHIGVGISGQEGMQAVLASDFAIAQFRFLQQLLFVHGRYSYLRMCKFLKYFFYKNFAITLCQVWYAFFSGFSAQTLFDESFISLYNFCYTSLPVLALGMFDQDVSVADSLKYPRLYVPGPLKLFFNKRIFSYCIIEATISSLVFFFVPLGSFYSASRPDGLDLAGHKAFGFTIASILIVAVTLRCGLDTDYWTGFNHLSIWGSIAFYYLFTFAFYSYFFEYTYCGTAVVVMATANFWFSMILSVVVLILPVMAEKFLHIARSPSLSDRIRLHQKVKTRSKSADLDRKKRPKGLGRGQSFKRSGYAFAHQEGFGELITTGKNMKSDRMRKESSLSSFAAVGRKVAEVIRPLRSKSREDNLSNCETPTGSQRSRSKENLLSVDSPVSAPLKKNHSKDSVTFAEVHNMSPTSRTSNAAEDDSLRSPLLIEGRSPEWNVAHAEDNGKKAKKTQGAVRFKDVITSSSQDSSLRQLGVNETSI